MTLKNLFEDDDEMPQAAPQQPVASPAVSSHAPAATATPPPAESSPLQLARETAPQESSDGPVRVVVAAPPAEGNPFVTALPPGNKHGVEVMSLVRGKYDLMDDVHQYRPHIVLISPNIRDYSVEIVNELARWPDYPIAVVGIVPNTGGWGSEMASNGAVGFYNTPISPHVVEQFTREARGIVDKARTDWRAPVIAAGVARPIVDVVGAMSFKTGVVAFWSTKGGVGKTALAIETAAVLSQLGGRRTLLVDANMNAGHVALRLGLYEQAEKSNIAHLAADYMTQKNRITAQVLAQRVFKADAHFDKQTRIVQNRLDLLLGLPTVKLAGGDPLRGKQGEQFMNDLLKLAREQYEYVIVDNGSSVAIGAHLGVLSAADLVLFVTSDDVASITDNRNTLAVLYEERSLNRDKFKVIVNQYNPQLSNIDLKTIAQFLRMPIFASVPDDTTRSFRNAGNEYKSFALSYLNIRKNSPEVEATMRGIFQIAEGIFPPLSPIIAARDGQLDNRKNGGPFGVFSFKKK